MFIREYVCQECKTLQEKWLKNSHEKNTDPCEKCGAPASELKPVISTMEKHLSWSKWAV